MEEEEFFAKSLARSVQDVAARLLFGECLAERGDWRADGYFWIGTHRKEPSQAARTYDWWHEDSTNRREIVVPDSMWHELDGIVPDSFSNCKEFPTLADAEEAIGRALITLKRKG